MKILQITLRPHHFLCLKGYKGYNYSTAQAGVWDGIAKVLKEKPNTTVVIGRGKDSLCKTCPASNNTDSNFFICLEKNIKELDKKVKQLLGLKTGEKVKYSTVSRKLNRIFTKEKHEELCSKCFWWQKGLCKESFPSKTKRKSL